MKKCSTQTRVRTKFSKVQINELEKLYSYNNKPSKEQMIELGQRADLELRIIQVWFQNRRVKERNQHLAQYDVPLPTHPCLSYMVKLMHMPTANSVTYPSPPIVPSSQFNQPPQPMVYPTSGMYLAQAMPSYPLHQDYSIYTGDFNQSLMSSM